LQQYLTTTATTPNNYCNNMHHTYRTRKNYCNNKTTTATSEEDYCNKGEEEPESLPKTIG
jgi:hypothetical protein